MEVRIAYTSGYEDCEDCGFYEWDQLRVEKDGEVVLDIGGDTHLGGPLVERSSPAEVVARVLGALGISVMVEERHG